MSRSLIYLVAGARPNFMKIAPIVRALQARADRFEFKIIHTGQHYDREMSDVFFDELGIPKPDYHLDAGGGSHATQTAKIMVAFEEICQKARPDCVLVVGDVNSTLACSIDAKKLGIPVIGVVDTNHSPEGIAHVIPGNDDSSRAIRLYARGAADAVLEGRSTVIQEIVQGGDEFVEVAEEAK